MDHEDRFETSLQDLNATNTNVAKLFNIITTLKVNLREIDFSVYKAHNKFFDLQRNFNSRLELIEMVFSNLQKQKYINSEIELIPIESKKSKNESEPLSE